MRLGGHLRRHVVGYLALFVALGGTSYAAIKLPKNSVGTKQLRNGAVTQKKIAAGTRRALRGQTGPQGPQGQRGADGAPGAPGAAGAPGPGAVRFSLDKTADPAPPAVQSTPLASADGVTIGATCAVSGFSLDGTLEIDTDANGQLITSYQHTFLPGPTNDYNVSSQDLLGADPATTFLGVSVHDEDEGLVHASAAFDTGSRTILIEGYIDVVNSTNRCHLYGAFWPAT